MRNLMFVVVAACVAANPPPGPYGPAPGPAPAAPNDPSAGGAGGAGGGDSGYAATISNQTANPVVLACDQRANGVKGAEHTSWYMQCPPCATTKAGLWGTDIYTDDSGVCAAALHSGALPPTGGVVLVTWIPGQLAYVGSERNGFRSQDYAHWGRSFFVQGVDASGRPVTPPPPMLPPGTARVSCSTPANQLPAGQPIHVICPSGCTHGGLWGTDVYTGDSSACLAAVHTGLISAAEGGTFTLVIGGPLPSFQASSRNGVTSQSYGSFGSSFQISR